MTTGDVIKSYNSQHGYTRGDVLFVRRLREAELSDLQIAAVIIALDQTCRHCMDANNPCNCQRDD